MLSSCELARERERERKQQEFCFCLTARKYIVDSSCDDFFGKGTGADEEHEQRLQTRCERAKCFVCLSDMLC